MIKNLEFINNEIESIFNNIKENYPDFSMVICEPNEIPAYFIDIFINRNKSRKKDIDKIKSELKIFNEIAEENIGLFILPFNECLGVINSNYLNSYITLYDDTNNDGDKTFLNDFKYVTNYITSMYDFYKNNKEEYVKLVKDNNSEEAVSTTATNTYNYYKIKTNEEIENSYLRLFNSKLNNRIFDLYNDISKDNTIKSFTKFKSFYNTMMINEALVWKDLNENDINEIESETGIYNDLKIAKFINEMKNDKSLKWKNKEFIKSYVIKNIANFYNN